MNPADGFLLPDDMTILRGIVAVRYWGSGPMLEAKKEDPLQIGRGIPGFAIRCDCSEKAMITRFIMCVLALKKMCVCFVGLVADGASVGVVLVNSMFIVMCGQPSVNEFDHKDVQVVSKSVDSSTKAKPIDEVARGGGPVEFLAKVRAHFARSVCVSHCLRNFVGNRNMIGKEVNVGVD